MFKRTILSISLLLCASSIMAQDESNTAAIIEGVNKTARAVIHVIREYKAFEKIKEAIENNKEGMRQAAAKFVSAFYEAFKR